MQIIAGQRYISQAGQSEAFLIIIAGSDDAGEQSNNAHWPVGVLHLEGLALSLAAPDAQNQGHLDLGQLHEILGHVDRHLVEEGGADIEAVLQPSVMGLTIAWGSTLPRQLRRTPSQGGHPDACNRLISRLNLKIMHATDEEQHLNVAQRPLCLAEVLRRAQHCLMGTATGITLLQPSPHRVSR